MRKHLLILVGMLAMSAPVTGQIAVRDPAVTAQNAAIAAVKNLLLNGERDQHAQLRRMARRLSLLTSLLKYRIDNPPRWRTHGGDFLFAGPYNGALIFGDPAGAAYLAVSHPVVSAFPPEQRLTEGARRSLRARLATIDATDASVMAATHDTGQLRFNGRTQELPAIQALEAHVIDPSAEQSATAVLDKMSGAALIGARQRQARVQLMVAVVEQLLTDTKRARDTDAAVMNMQLVTWRDGQAANRAFIAGAGDALRVWRQP